MKILKVYLLPLLALLLIPMISHASDGEEFEVDGIKVILKPSVKEVISVRLFVNGGTANYPKDKEGIEALTLNLATSGGTVTMPKVEFNNELEKIGTSINSSTNFDYGDVSFCSRRSFKERLIILFCFYFSINTSSSDFGAKNIFLFVHANFL